PEAEAASGRPPGERDLRGQEGPDRVVLGPNLEPEVQADSGAVAEGGRGGDDGERGERGDEGGNREVRPTEAKGHGPDAKREDGAREAAHRHAREGGDLPGRYRVAERVGPCAHENDVAEAHISGHPRDQIERVRPRRVNHEENQKDEEGDGEDRTYSAEDHEEDTEALRGRPEGLPPRPEGAREAPGTHAGKTEPRRPSRLHRRIPSGANARTGMTARNATAYAISVGMNTWRTSIRTPIVIPPTRLPHILPGPPRTTITKLMGAYRWPMSGRIPTRR